MAKRDEKDKKIFRKKRASVDVMIKRYKSRINKIKKRLALKELKKELDTLMLEDKENI